MKPWERGFALAFGALSLAVLTLVGAALVLGIPGLLEVADDPPSAPVVIWTVWTGAWGVVWITCGIMCDRTDSWS